MICYVLGSTVWYTVYSAVSPKIGLFMNSDENLELLQYKSQQDLTKRIEIEGN